VIAHVAPVQDTTDIGDVELPDVVAADDETGDEEGEG
jgi:hypothetical protein